MKTLLAGLSSTLCKLCLYGLAITVALGATFGTPKILKQSLKDSGIYDVAVDEAISSAAKDEPDQPYQHPAVIAAAKQAFPPSTIQTSVEHLLDDMYAYLQGKSATFTVKIDVSGSVQTFANNLASYASDRYQKLPACTLSQARELASKPADLNGALYVPCQIPTLTATDVKQQVLDGVSGENSPVPNGGVITEDELNKQDGDKQVPNSAKVDETAQKKLEPIRTIIGLLKWLPLALGAGAIVGGLGVLFASKTKRRGLRSLGITLVGTALFIGLSCLIFSKLFSYANGPSGPIGKADAGQFQKPLVSIATSLNSNINHTLYSFTFVYGLIGVVLLVGIYLMGRKQATLATEGTPTDQPVTPHHTAAANDSVTLAAPDDEQGTPPFSHHDGPK